MKYCALVNPGLENICGKEIKELINLDTKISPGAVEFDSDPKKALSLLHRAQSVRRLLLQLGTWKKTDKINLENIKWPEWVASGLSFRAEVENLKGQENRLAVAKAFVGAVFTAAEKQHISLSIDLKKPDFLLVVHFNGTEYFAGLDLAGFELNARDYRVFTNSASCKGDIGYFFARRSGFVPGKKLLVGFAKDGVISIEAALYANNKPVHRKTAEEFSYSRLPLFKGLNYGPAKTKKASVIIAIDESNQNVIAARKNAQIAGVRELVSIQRMYLDELSGTYAEKEFDNLIFQITTKDEDKLNEMYHQAEYLLKPKGTLLFISRRGWDAAISSKFTLVAKEELERGEHIYKILLLKKK
ncbi:MAG: THUMP domain-containing protein [Nanoarchaeota archaeon]